MPQGTIQMSNNENQTIGLAIDEFCLFEDIIKSVCQSVSQLVCWSVGWPVCQSVSIGVVNNSKIFC